MTLNALVQQAWADHRLLPGLERRAQPLKDAAPYRNRMRRYGQHPVRDLTS